jgi:hypothetical protein
VFTLVLDEEAEPMPTSPSVSAWQRVVSASRGLLATRFMAATGACLVLCLIATRPLRAQNPGTAFNISGPAGFETGLRALAYIEPPIQREGGSGVNVNWGDGTGGFEGLTQKTGSDSNYWVYGTHAYAQPGTYQITVSYDWESSCGLFCSQTSHALLTATATITPPGKFVIVSIGDSIASGEGNPSVRNRSGANGTTVPAWSFWDDAYSSYEGYLNPTDEAQEWPSERFPCHRSGRAGPAQAAGQLVASNPESGITFIHYACSGATIEPNDTRASEAPGGWVQDAVGQLKIARERLAQYGAGIDVLLISAGSNSLYGPNSFGDGFGGLVKYCLKQGGCSANPAVQGDLDSSFAALPAAYGRLAMAINCQQSPPFPGVNGVSQNPDPGCTDSGKQIPKLVLITEYMDPSRDENGNFPTSNTCGPAFVKLVYPDDFQFFYNSVVHPLNEQVDRFPEFAAQAGLSAPTYAVTGIESDFRNHGVCAGKMIAPHVELKGVERWVNNGNDSLYLLGEGPAGYPNEQDCGLVNLVSLGGCGTEQLNGMLHPNSALLAATLGNIEGLTPTCPPRCGQEDYRDRIQAAIVTHNPPVTTPGATADGSPYAFGTWTTHDVTVTLSATNPIGESGVGTTLYAVDNPICSSVNPAGCLTYGGPFTITTSGKHTVTFFSQNAQGYPEATQRAQVWVDNQPPVMTCAATPFVLWPPNNKLVPVALNVTAVSAAFGPVPVVLHSVTTSEGDAAADIVGFVVGQPSASGYLRATRTGYAKAGGIYAFVYRAADPAGLAATCTATVTVPHDRSKSKP